MNQKVSVTKTYRTKTDNSEKSTKCTPSCFTETMEFRTTTTTGNPASVIRGEIQTRRNESIRFQTTTAQPQPQFIRVTRQFQPPSSVAENKPSYPTKSSSKIGSREKHTADVGLLKSAHAPPSTYKSPVIPQSQHESQIIGKYGGSNQKYGVSGDEFAKEIVSAHNKFRTIHQVPSVRESSSLSTFSQKWAEHLARIDMLLHSTAKDGRSPGIGENLFMGYCNNPQKYTGQQITDNWYSEIQFYDFADPNANKDRTGHFTNVVWKTTREIGVGRAISLDGQRIFIVVNYQPAGNMQGGYSENVLPPRPGKKELAIKNTITSDKVQQSIFSERFEKRSPVARTKMATRKEVRTFTETKGSGADKEVTVTVETTITKPDGSKEVTKEVTVTRGESAGQKCGGGANKIPFDKLSLGDKSESNEKPQDIKEFREEALKIHNEKRKIHGVNPLEHSQSLSDYAQKWAEHLAATDSFSHSSCTLDKERLGENISMKFSSDPNADATGSFVTEQWYSEINKLKDADYDLTTFPGGTGHFTQVVWKESKEVGFGKAKSKSGKIYSVGSYKPAGNMRGAHNQNVFRPK